MRENVIWGECYTDKEKKVSEVGGKRERESCRENLIFDPVLNPMKYVALSKESTLI